MRKREPIKQHVRERVPISYKSNHDVYDASMCAFRDSMLEQPWEIGILPKQKVEQLMDFYLVENDGTQSDFEAAVVVAASSEEAIKLIDEDYESGITATKILPMKTKIILSSYFV